MDPNRILSLFEDIANYWLE